MTGTVSAPTRGQCSRCLGDHRRDRDLPDRTVRIPGQRHESTTKQTKSGRRGPDHRHRTVDRGRRGLAPLRSCQTTARDCTQCGVVLATAEPDHGHDVIDPRWAKLSGCSPTRAPRRDFLPRQNVLDALGVDLPDELLTLALTHRCYAYETVGCPPASGWNSSAMRGAGPDHHR